ncbi:hypothetical protein ES288_D10G131400v1 [Gossypium darwinii]|uniref:PUB2-4-like N-terminal domain-containing protein n=1 Tax=Gossypium darwinii TaxID=34276 RepID=A0A5D2AZC6_GOSDA|nr:hypothetical protein ES288_D10G131400v1 [Gossypium darwinii]
MHVSPDHLEISLLKALLGNISSFLNLCSFENINSEPVQKFYQRAEEILELLKPILSAVIDSEITSDKVLGKAFEGLRLSKEELREQFESWQPLLSKVYFVFSAFGFVHKITTFEKTVGFQSGIYKLNGD